MNRLRTYATLLLAGAVVAHATPASDARASLAQLRRAITHRDAQLLTQLLGSSRFRAPGTTQIRWDDVDDYVRSAEAVVASPVRTVSGQTSIGQPQFAIIGWEENTLRAARFLKDDQNRWLLAKLHLGATARTAADRQAFERYVRQVSEQRLADGFFRGNITTLGNLVTELEGLRATPRPAAPPPDPLDDLLSRYRRVWFNNDCAAAATLYDARATLKNQLGTYDISGIQRFCQNLSPRPECAVTVQSQTRTAHGLTVRISVWCSINATSGTGWNRNLQIDVQDGMYRIMREEELP